MVGTITPSIKEWDYYHLHLMEGCATTEKLVEENLAKIIEPKVMRKVEKDKIT